MPKGRKPGAPKTGGRAKGTPNKRTVAIKEIKEICEEQGFNPFAILVQLCQHDDPGIQLAAVREACQYIAPKQRILGIGGIKPGDDEMGEGPKLATLAELVGQIGNK